MTCHEGDYCCKFLDEISVVLYWLCQEHVWVTTHNKWIEIVTGYLRALICPKQSLSK